MKLVLKAINNYKLLVFVLVIFSMINQDLCRKHKKNNKKTDPNRRVAANSQDIGATSQEPIKKNYLTLKTTQNIPKDLDPVYESVALQKTKIDDREKTLTDKTLASAFEVFKIPKDEIDKCINSMVDYNKKKQLLEIFIGFSKNNFNKFNDAISNNTATEACKNPIQTSKNALKDYFNNFLTLVNKFLYRQKLLRTERKRLEEKEKKLRDENTKRKQLKKHKKHRKN